jgi:hypothetical protein
LAVRQSVACAKGGTNAVKKPVKTEKAGSRWGPGAEFARLIDKYLDKVRDQQPD